MDRQLTLYYFPAAFYSQKVLLCLEEKDLPYKSVLINILAGESQKPSFIKINPKGQVPVLKHADKFIADSQNIVEYLDATFGDCPKLIPDPSSEEGKFLKELGDLCRNVRVEVLTFGIQNYPELLEDSEVPERVKKAMLDAQKPETKKALQKQFQDLADKHPELRSEYLEMKEEAGKRWNTNREGVIDEVEKCQKVFKLAEEQLSKNAFGGKAHNWLATPNLTLTDLEVGLLLHRFKVLGLAKATWKDGKHQNLEKFYQRLCGRESFNKITVSVKFGPTTGMIVKQMLTKAAPVATMVSLGAAAGALGLFLYKKFT